MKPTLMARLRTGAIALGVMAGLTAPVLATPAGIAAQTPTPTASSSFDGNVMKVDRRGNGVRYWRHGKMGGGNNFYKKDRPRFSYRDNDRHDFRRKNHHRRYYHRNRDYWDGYWGPGLVLGLGLGVPAYDYYSSPRRVYRGLSRAHVEWCHDRWRSYRAYDNSYQPNHGPRRQCRSPYG